MRTIRILWMVAATLMVAMGGVRLGAQETTTGTAPTAPLPYQLQTGDLLGLSLSLDPPKLVEHQPIALGDTLGLFYQFAPHDPTQPYHLRPGDEVFLSFRYSPELSQVYYKPEDDKISVLSREYVVQPQGTLVLSGLPEPLNVFDKTPQEVSDMVREAYKDILTVPDVLVDVAPRYMKELSLKEMFTEEEKLPVYRTLSSMRMLVPSDGRICLPVVGSLKVAGLDLEQASTKISEQYAKKDYLNVKVTVWLDQVADQAHEPLRQLIASSPGPLQCEVLPDGSISLPLVESLPVAGRSVAQTSQDLTAHLRAMGMPRARATVWVQQRRPLQVTIMGEVAKPGVYELEPGQKLWHIIAKAGGFTREANQGAIRILGPAPDQMQGPFDLKNCILLGQAWPALSGRELIYVPAKSQAQ